MHPKSLAVTLLSLIALAPAAHAVGQLTDLTIYDRTEGRTLPVYQHEGRYYVAGTPGNEYQVQIRNQSGGDVLTVVSVDGVNVISGETAHWQQSGYVLDSWSSVDIKGWRKGLDRTAAFYFTRLPDSYAARTGRPDNVGVIGVAVFERKIEPLPVPYPAQVGGAADAASESAMPAPSSRAEGSLDGKLQNRRKQERERSSELMKDSRLGTGHGRSETSYARYTQFERATDSPAEFISIYYDSYRNLIAQGIVPDDRPRPPLAVNPFPGAFVPDPPR